METIILKVRQREEVGKNVKTLREEGFIPAVLYGHKVDNKNLAVAVNEFMSVYQDAGTSTIIDLIIEGGEAVKVIIADTQKDAVRHNVIHIDLQQVNMKETITAMIPLHFIGESAAVKQGGVLLKHLEEVGVKCLPANLPHSFTVDLGKLKSIDSRITIEDLGIPANVEVSHGLTDVVALVKGAKIEVEPEVAEADAVAKVEVQGEKKDEEAKK